MKQLSVKFAKRAGVLIMAMATMVSTTGCLGGSYSTASKVTKALEEKYGEKFTATSIGNRLNTGSATLYLYPSDNKDLLFTATISNSTGEVEDDYAIRKVCYQIESQLVQNCEDAGVSAVACCVITPKSDLDVDTEVEYTPETFLSTYGEKGRFDDYLMYIVVDNSNLDIEAFETALLYICNKLNVELGCYVFFAPDEEAFEACEEYFAKYPSVTEASIARRMEGKENLYYCCSVSPGDECIIRRDVESIVFFDFYGDSED